MHSRLSERTRLHTLMLCALVLGTDACGDDAALQTLDEAYVARMMNPATCNGRVDSCARRLDETVMLMTHNAMSSVEAQFTFPNQTHGLTGQLNAGVRGLMLDVHMFQSAPYLCHANCKRGRTPLVNGLGEIDAFLHAVPDAVIVVIVEDYVPTDMLADALMVSHLDTHVQQAPADGELWPTLGEMVRRDTRLVLFSEHTQGGPAWYPHAWQHVRDTPYQAFLTRDFTCAHNRGPEDGTFLLINHWLGPQHPNRAKVANQRRILQAHVDVCANLLHRLPNFIGVDFYEIGDVWDVVGWVEDAWRAGL